MTSLKVKIILKLSKFINSQSQFPFSEIFKRSKSIKVVKVFVKVSKFFQRSKFDEVQVEFFKFKFSINNCLAHSLTHSHILFLLFRDHVFGMG